MATACDVCGGTGLYPVINSGGRELYCIECPECLGDGIAIENDDSAKKASDAVLVMKYVQAMAEKHGRSLATETSNDTSK